MNVIQRLAANTKALRSKRGMTQAQLAEDIGCGRARISEIELSYKDIRLTTIERLANALEVSVSQILK